MGSEGVLLCATAVMKKNKPDGASFFFLLLCFLVALPSVSVSLSLSDFEFEIRFLYPAHIEMKLCAVFEAL